MALGSKASQERRHAERAAAEAERARDVNAAHAEVQRILSTLTPSEQDRRQLRIEAYILSLRATGLAPTDHNRNLVNLNIVRLAEGKTPIEARGARIPRWQIKRIRQRW